MNMDLSLPFTRLDQIQFVESEIRRMQFLKSPTKAKKVAMLENIVAELRKLTEIQYPAKLLCVKLDYLFEGNVLKSGGWFIAVDVEFNSKLSEYVKTQQNRNRIYFVSDVMEISPKLELFGIAKRILTRGFDCVNSQLSDYVHEELDCNVLTKHNQAVESKLNSLGIDY